MKTLLEILREKISPNYSIEEITTEPLKLSKLEKVWNEYIDMQMLNNMHFIADAMRAAKLNIKSDYYFTITADSIEHLKLIESKKIELNDFIESHFNAFISFKIQVESEEDKEFREFCEEWNKSPEEEEQGLDTELDYYEYLKSREWRLLRNRIFRQRGFYCELCNSQRNLQIHHITYERLGNEDDNDLMILCQVCHEKSHNKCK